MHFEVLLKRISPTLQKIAYRLNGHFSFLNQEDLYQEALVHLWQDFNAGKLTDKTDSYILQGCYFHLKNYLRTASVKNREISLEKIALEKNSSVDEVLSLKDEASENYLDYLNSKMFAEAISNNGLTKREKDIIFLHAEGLTTREIGQRVQLSHVRVLKLLAQIKEKCKKYLDKF